MDQSVLSRPFRAALPAGPSHWFSGDVQDCTKGQIRSVDLSTNSVISSNRSHSSEQADVPAEQPSPAQEARLPSSDAYPCGSRHHRRPPWQGSPAPRGLSDLIDGDHLVLPASNRLRRSDDFSRAVRSGRRAARRAVVLHQLAATGHTGPARVGFVVNKAVGNAVLRNRVHRRLRAVLATRLPDLPAGSLTVVRALPSSATASYDDLVADVDGALRRLLKS